MKPTQQLTADERFFFDCAGWSYDPKTETEAQGRTRSAIEAARDEELFMHAARVADVRIVWEHDEEMAQEKEHKETCEMASIYGPGDALLAHLGGIDDADEDYRRVIRAQLAHECADELRAIIRRSADYGYLQHGAGTAGPFCTERVRVQNEHGDKWLAYFMGKWRRVHIQLNRTFIVYQGERITIQIEGV